MTEWADIRDSVRLDEVLDALGVQVADYRKGEHWASCPMPTHPSADASPSFSVNEDTLLYNCFTCSDGGHLPQLVMRLLEDEVETWDDAVTWLIPFSDGEVSEDDDEGFLEQIGKYLDREGRPRHERRSLLPYFSTRILDALEPAPLDILAKWNIHSLETVERFQLRYDPERRRLKRNKEYVAPALIIPHFWKGELVGYQERWLSDDRPGWVPKYTNSDGFPKSTTLYDWDRTLAEAPDASKLIVESAMTRIRLWELGYPAFGTFGVSITDEQMRLLRSVRGGVVLSADDDPDYLNTKGELVSGAGRRSLSENANRLSEYIPVEILPFVGKAKGDLADLDANEVHDLYRQRKPVFAELPTYKSRKQRV